MKMKKLAALALSAVFALGALTACGGSSSSGSVPAAASASGSGSVSGASLKEVNTGEGLKIHDWMRGYLTYGLPVIVLFIFAFGIYDKFFA